MPTVSFSRLFLSYDIKNRDVTTENFDLNPKFVGRYDDRYLYQTNLFRLPQFRPQNLIVSFYTVWKWWLVAGQRGDFTAGQKSG